jgi:UDP-N-acetyl-D-mannosaminuronate dehydrogenase
VADTLKRCGKGLKRARILILGVSFKANVKDANNSTAGALGGLLKKRGARVTVWDPFFKASELEALGFKASPSLDEALEGADCVVVSVGHDQFRQQKQKILSGFSKKGIFAVVDCSGSNIFSPEDSTEKVICASLGVSSS